MPERETKVEQAPETEGRTITWFARFYDWGSWLMSFGQEDKTNREIVARAGVQPGERVLDVGCGTGAQTIPTAEIAGPGNVSGIDPSPQMLELARRKAAKKRLEIDFRLAVIENLPFEEGQFDAVLSCFMLHHLPEDVARLGLGEVRRVLKPGGRLLAVDLVAGHSFVGRIIGLFGHAHRAQGVERIEEIMLDAGLESVEELPARQGHVVYISARRGE